ncbi:MAG: HU family DNA-binding protein [Bacteroidota bacterium]|nr:HU family DNA-binding protein [Bacteroidota bacterium]
MNKNDIKSEVSIEFGLSIEKAGRIVDSIFYAIADSLRKSKDIELRKFGKINIISKKDSQNNKLKKIIYFPSKKLAKSVNYNFENLTEQKIKSAVKEFDNSDKDKFDYKMSDEFIKEFKENKEEVLDIIVEYNEQKLEINIEDNVKSTKAGRQLIPDNLVKLHKEITEEETKENEKNNLWG